MAELITGLEVRRVAANLAAVRERIAAAAVRTGRAPEDIEIVAAAKYVDPAEMGVLAAAGIAVVGENRVQDLVEKVGGAGFTWDFIGHIQSRKVRQIVPHVRMVHSLCTESARDQLLRHAPKGLRVLVQVNVAGEAGKDGVDPDALGGFLAGCRGLAVTGLMTMPPLAGAPEDNRRWFAALRALAAAHGLSDLSMGTTQDFEVAVEEGATHVRIGTSLYR